MGTNYRFRFAQTLASRYYSDIVSGFSTDECFILISGFLDCLIYSGYIYDHEKPIIYNELINGDYEAHKGLPE